MITIEGFIIVNQLENDLKALMPQLATFTANHSLLKQELQKVDETKEWVKVNQLAKDCMSLNCSILESELMKEYSKFKVMNEFREMKNEGSPFKKKISSAEREVAQRVKDIKEKLEEEYQNKIEEFKIMAEKNEEASQNVVVSFMF